MFSKVRKVLAKSLKNATEQHDEVIQASRNASIKFKCAVFPFMSINPLTTADFVIKINTHKCVLCYTTVIAVFSVEKTDSKSYRVAQDMLQGKINHEQIRTSRLSKT